MHYVLDNWSFDPFIIVVAVVVAWHEIGLPGSPGGHGRSGPGSGGSGRSGSTPGLLVLLLAVVSPVDYWSDSYFMVHMVQHLLLMFAAPSLVVAGAPGQPLLDALPGRSGKTVTREVLSGGWSRPVRAVWLFLDRPGRGGGAVQRGDDRLAYPGAPFDLAQNNQLVHIWLMHASFFLAGVLFWLQFIPSPPFRPDAAARPGHGAAGHQRGHDLHRDGLSIFASRSTRCTTTCLA